jgi:hypothetical protein
MKTQPLKSKYDYAPRQRRLFVHAWFIVLTGLILFIAFTMLMGSCSTPKHGCRSTWGMSGYNPKQY